MGGAGVWATGGLRERVARVAELAPSFRDGGLSWHELREVARVWGASVGLRVAIDLREGWPLSGSIQRIGEALVVFIDARLGHWARRYVLAHEVGHLVLGHYDVADDRPWYMTDGLGASEMEREAETFACLATRSPGLPLELYLRTRLDG